MTKKTLEQSSTPKNFFSNQDVIDLGKFWIQQHEVEDKDFEEYNQGIIDGVEYMLYLLERCGD